MAKKHRAELERLGIDSRTAHYVDDLTFTDLHRVMEGCGFELANLAPVHAANGVALWSDALYSHASGKP